MSYIINGVLYIGSVPWGSDYKNVWLASTRKAHYDYFVRKLKRIEAHIVFAHPNAYIDVKGDIGSLNTVNYLMFSNSTDIEESNLYHCFVNSYEYLSPQTTRLYIELDVFQQYIWDTTFNECYIERAHISKSDDYVGANLESEPVSAVPSVTRNINNVFSEDDWQPQWVLHTTSYFNSGTKKYEYGGLSEYNTFGEYGKYIDSKSDLTNLLEDYGRKSMDDVIDDVSIDWKKILNAFLSGGTSSAGMTAITSATSIAELQDHRDELIGMYAIPKWARESTPWATNNRITKSSPLSLRNNLACGYTPRNKKLLSSVYKAYILYSRNGTILSFKPEVFKKTPSCICSCIPMGTSKVNIYISNYDDMRNSYKSIPYSCERRIGYDSNTGLNKTLNVLNAVTAMANSTKSGNFIGSFLPGINAIDAMGEQGTTVGSNGELIDIVDGQSALRWADVSPTYNECVHIDKYFDMYGYSQNTIGNPLSNMRTRSEWNYVKTKDISLSVGAPEEFINKLKEIFNNGVRVWHNINHFGDYNYPNE